MFFVLASDLPLICPPQKHRRWRDVKETEEAVVKRGGSEIVSADDVGDAEIEALGAGKHLLFGATSAMRMLVLSLSCV